MKAQVDGGCGGLTVVGDGRDKSCKGLGGWWALRCDSLSRASMGRVEAEGGGRHGGVTASDE